MIPAFVEQPDGSCQIGATTAVLHIVLLPFGNYITQL